jgi:hypothetical protein
MVNDARAPADTLTIIGERTLLFQKNITSVDEAGTYMCRRSDESDLMMSIVDSSSLVVECKSDVFLSDR